MKINVSISDRQDEIVTQPQRITPLTNDNIPSSTRAIVNEVLGLISAPIPDEFSAHTATFIRHPDLYKQHSLFAMQLFKGQLVTRHRELAVLRIGWISQSPFEWGEHVKIARRLVGLSDEEILAVKTGSDHPIWSKEDRSIICAVEELMSVAMISNKTWNLLAGFLSEKQLIELPVLVGHYLGVAFLQNSLRTELLQGSKGLFEE